MTTTYDDDIRAQGYSIVAGIDEVGLGALAGPLMACCIVLPPGLLLPGVDDSKKLSPRRRQELEVQIRGAATGIGIGICTNSEIDSIGDMGKSVVLAMTRALEGLELSPDIVLLDGTRGLPVGVPQRTIIRGDSISVSIAAASIVAKVARDAIMVELEAHYPEYGFAIHKGYGTRAHMKAISEHGPSPVHRLSFSLPPQKTQEQDY